MHSHAAPIQRRRFTRADYHAMGRAGILGEGERVELLAGEVVRMAPNSPRDCAIIDRFARHFVSRAADQAIVRVRGSFALDSESEPQPDVLLLRPRPDFYEGDLPGPSDVLLVVEVAESSLAFDLGEKAALYARAGIVEYWVVDTAARTVVVHQFPADARFASIEAVSAREAVLRPSLLPQAEVRLSETFTL